MIKLSPLSTVAVIGLGRVGRIIAQFLLHKKIFVYAYDDNKNIFTQKELMELINNPQFVMMTGYRWPIYNRKPVVLH